MGTASLVFGLALIIIGFGFIINEIIDVEPTVEEWGSEVLVVILVLGIPLIVVGSLLLRKYDRDKKKEKNS